MTSVTVLHAAVDADDGHPLLDDVSFTVPDGRVAALLGPSGAGKTTLLRLIAGLQTPHAGTVLLGDDDVTDLPPQQRDVAMVFQNAWLHPHLDVRDNVAFPLTVRRLPDDEVERRVEAEARSFSIRRLLRKRPRQLSMGERRAASSAHALVRRPRAILMDEPLAGIDPQHRDAALAQIATVQSGYGTTMLVATNDPYVATRLATEIVVLEAGRLRQAGAFQDLYDRPEHVTVAQLLGELPVNRLSGGVVTRDGRPALELPGGVTVAVPPRLAVGARVTVLVRAEHLAVTASNEHGALPAVVERVACAGAYALAEIRLTDGSLLFARTLPPGPDVGTHVGALPRRLHVFDQAGRSIAHL